MDFHAVVSAIQSAINMPTEHFQQRRQQVIYVVETNPAVMFVSLLITFFAIYLSWTRNTQRDESTEMKIFYAFFAGMFGLTYLIFYVFRDLVQDCGKPSKAL